MPKTLPPQHQNNQPGIQSDMTPQPQTEKVSQIGTGKLLHKIALITDRDTGIGRARAVAVTAYKGNPELVGNG